MNKEEALTKRCPIKQDGNNNCIADKCMLWQWEYDYTFRENWRSPVIISISKTNGHCGLKNND